MGPCIAIGKKRGEYWVTPKTKVNLFGKNKKTNHKLSKAFYISKYHILRLNFEKFFWQKKVIFTPAKTTIAASQLYLLGIKH